MGRYSLTQEDVEAYNKDGYLVVKNVLAPYEVAETHRVIQAIIEEQRPLGDNATKLEWEPELVNGQRVPRRIYRPVEQHEVFYRTAVSDKILDRVESLVGPDIQLHTSKLNMKLAKVGSIVDWHQDLAFLPHTNTDLVVLLIYLDDATMENGCLQVIPGVHHGDLMDHSKEGIFVGRITEPIPRADLPAPVACEAPAGSMILMHYMTPHRSLPNRSERPRQTLIYEYRAADAYPIYLGDRSVANERWARQVRGKRSPVARFSRTSVPIPYFAKDFRSLYDLQAYDPTLTVADKGGD